MAPKLGPLPKGSEQRDHLLLTRTIATNSPRTLARTFQIREHDHTLDSHWQLVREGRFEDGKRPEDAEIDAFSSVPAKAGLMTKPYGM